MAGGAGERFWPVSRGVRPKHLWDITGTGTCLLEQSFRRIADVVPEENILIVTNREQIEGIRSVCPFIRRERLIAEPACRDTLAAVGLGALWAERLGGDETVSVAVFPSDHVIPDTENFVQTAKEAFFVAESGDFLVTIGIRPTRPSTAFGYIQAGGAFSCGNAFGFDVEKFHEKPAFETALRYLSQGNFYWNAGMFFWKSSSIKAAIRKNAPQVAETFRLIESRLKSNADLERTLAEFYPLIEKKSVDFAIMEKADNVKVVPAKFAWDDVGTWAAAERHLPRGDGKNAFRGGSVFAEKAEGNVVFDVSGRTTALFGVRDLIVVHTADATLVCAKECAENLKSLVKKLPPNLR